MINPHKSFSLHNYIDIFLRRIWYIVIPLVVITIGAGMYAYITPKVYRAVTMVLVTPQKVPESFIRPTVTADIQDRLQSISQEILSRTRLEQLVSEFKLYPEALKNLPMEQVVETMRKDIKFEISRQAQGRGRSEGSGGGSFTIAYEGKNPQLVTQVTNKLASLFIEENLKLREQQAQGTVDFLTHELNTTKQTLDEQEKVLTNFKKQFLNELPEQRDANLQVLGQLQVNNQRIGESLKSAEDRKLLIQNRLGDLEMGGSASLVYMEDLQRGRSGSAAPPRIVSPQEHQLNQLRSHLSELEAKYTSGHPDVINTKKKITDLEKAIRESASKKEMGDRPEEGRTSVHYETLKRELIPINLEIQRLRKEEARIKGMIADYQGRIEKSPVREIAQSQLLQDYNQTKEAYQNLMKKKEEAQQAENLERRQKGEQFKVIDPARVPTTPFKPNVQMVLLIGLLAGLGSGFGLAFLREQMDRSFRDAEDVETTLGLRVLANIPKIETETAA